VIGGGAAGFFCAVNAARLNRELEVIIVEKSNKLLSKVRISGAGRCNVTHNCFDIADMSSRYPRGGNFVKKTFHQFFTTDTIQWFEGRGVKLKAEADGRMFPVTDSSQSIIDCLLNEAATYNVSIRMRTEVTGITKGSSAYNVECSGGQGIYADMVCIACGGYPKSAMFEWLRLLDHSIAEPVPSLFTFNLDKHPITSLMGISVEDVNVKIPSAKLEQRGPVLITHWGFSGPAILKLSAWGARKLAATNWRFAITVNWLPQWNEQELAGQFRVLRFQIASQKIGNRNPFDLPQRLWEYLLEHSSVDKEKRWSDLPSKDQNKLIKNICAGEFLINGKTTFKEEFVTAGGISLAEVDANTMMSKKCANVFFAGEILDVDGITGGYNFQHAWTSGFVAAKNIAMPARQATIALL
jgi:predicted Rossmann fold flavoprotein